ncbi:MAG: GNAT family N-acetyltransferase [Gemmatimonadetes bacterium]|nr:GNAT family N-acetyltransferase [Gemmatimonadota bacterium]
MGLHQASYQDDPTLCDRVFELLELPFPGVSAGRRQGEGFGVPWERCSTPFVAREENRVSCHVGLLEVPIRVLGRDLVAGGVHGVATHPERRRQGLFRGVMSELLVHAGTRFDTLFLTALHPEYFADFGFRVVPEFVHRTGCLPTRVSDSRPLDLGSPADLALMHRLLDTRSPISDYLGVGSEKGCFGFVEFGSTIRYSPGLDAAVIAAPTERGVRIYDVVAPTLPAFPEVLGIAGSEGSEAICYFAPDRFAGSFRPEPHDLTGGPDALEPGTAGWVMMVRGPFRCDGFPVMLPRPARC